MNVLLIGIDYFVKRDSGDKNFWYNNLSILSKSIDKIVVISFNYRNIKNEKQMENILILNKKPFHLGVSLKKDNAQFNNIDKCHSHFQIQPRSLIERSFSVLKNIFIIKSIINKYNIKAIHFMDNFGPVMGLVSWFLPKIPVYCSAISYMARGVFQDQYLLYSFRNVTKVIPYSDSYNRKLVSLGIPESRVKTIHWGILYSSGKNEIVDREKAKNIIGLHKDTVCILWSGFIQQIQEDSLKVSIEIANTFLNIKNYNVKFIFTLKPECFKKEYLKFENGNIKIKCTNYIEFNSIEDATDIMLSPITNFHSIASPPLTWIECMAKGIPVFTNNAPGTDEIIRHNHNGYIGESNEMLVSGIQESIKSKSYLQWGKNAREFVKEHYNIEKISQQYIELWSK